MQTSLHASVFAATGIEALIEEAAAAGIGEIEVSVGKTGILALDAAQTACTEWKQLAEAKGVAISALTLDDPQETDFGVEDDALRAAASDRTVAALDRAQWLGVDMVVVSPGIVGNSQADGDRRGPCIRYEDVHTRSLEALLALRFEAGLRGIRIAVRCGANGFLLSPIEARAFLDRLNSPWMLASVDLDTIRQVGSPTDWLLTMARRLGHLFVRLPENSDVMESRLAEHASVQEVLREIRYPGVLTCAGGKASELATRIVELLQSTTEDAESE